ncbi:DUF4258 domain-containing protein [Bosea sp. 47.2.35]|uniref:DUF4258 domain-containing protein n=1 Tax=Bosea sp. 47.2.35 TaxID=2969304 RepID=UPI0035ADA9ED
MRKQPWKPADATEEIRALGGCGKLTLSWTDHIRARLVERDLVMGDVRYILRHGFVYDPPEEATQPGLYKYRIETRTPNSNNRVVRLVVIPDPSTSWAKLVTLMWADEN